MLKNKILFQVQLLLCSSLLVWCACPVEDDPTNLARCIQVDVSAIVGAIKGSNDFTSFCALADRYMECFKTYTRGCVGFYFGEGALTELQNIALYCCNGITSSRDCPFNPNVKRTCIDSEAMATLHDGSKKAVGKLEIGDKVKTIDANGRLVDTDVIMMMDISQQESLFFNIATYSNKQVRVSASHLISLPNGEFKFAKLLNREDSILVYDNEKQLQVNEKIKSILIEPVEGYAAPLTMEGTLLVNDILVSSYAIMESQSLAHTAMAPVRWWYKLYSQLDNTVPESIFSTLQIEKQMNGTHWYPSLLHSLTEQYLAKFVQFH